jgi:hypothetical protein
MRPFAAAVVDVLWCVGFRQEAAGSAAASSGLPRIQW